MTVGRKPKATFLHVVQGTLHATKHAKRKLEPNPTGDLHDPPVHLSAAQREIWAQQLRDAPLGLLKRLDWSNFMAWVVACDIHRMALVEINKLGPEGLVVQTAPRRGPAGNQQNPLLGVLNRQALIIAKLSSELGFSPVARARVTVDPTKEINPFDEFA